MSGPRRPALSPGARLALGAAAGVFTVIAAGLAIDFWLGALLGIGVASGVFVIAGWSSLWPLDAASTRDTVRANGFRPHIAELVVGTTAASGLLAIVILLLAGRSEQRTAVAVSALVAAFAVWAALHLTYASQYATLYYGGEGDEPRGIDWGGDEQPAYRDFFYFSYNLGMTYQVSDNAVTDREIRSVVLRHCLLSYVFGTLVLATSINLVMGVVSG